MDIAQVKALELQVLWLSFAVCVAFGAIAQRTHFCTMGALSDIFNMGSWDRMRMWGLAVGVAMVAFQAWGYAGWIDPGQSLYAASRVLWLSGLVGGALFGFGMVLASGCGSKTLVRIGEGNLKSVVVFVVMGLAAYASMRGLTALWRSRSLDLVSLDMATSGTLPAWLASAVGIGDRTLGLVLGLVVGGALIGWALIDRGFRSDPVNWIGGIGVGAAVAAMWWVIGHVGFVAEHPETLEATYLGTAGGRMQALSFTSPMARTLEWFIAYDPGKALSLGMVSVLGVVVGAWAHALYDGSFQWEGFQGAQDTGLHLAGAVLMGIGGVTAGGCTVGQGLSGLSTLSVSSLFAVAGIVLGALGGLRLQQWLVMRSI